MLGHELNGMIHVPRLKHANAADLFLGFRIGTVGGRDFAVLPIQGQGGFSRLKSFSDTKLPVGAQMVPVLKAFVEHCVPLVLGHGRDFFRIVVSQTDVFHCSSPLVGGQRRVVSQFGFRLTTQGGPDASAQSVGRVARLEHFHKYCEVSSIC